MASAEVELLHLVDRAEGGTLLAAEAQQLRDGIRRYAAAERAVLDGFNAARQILDATLPALRQVSRSIENAFDFGAKEAPTKFVGCWHGATSERHGCSRQLGHAGPHHAPTT